MDQSQQPDEPTQPDETTQSDPKPKAADPAQPVVLIEISPTVDDLYGEEVMRDVFTDRVKEFTTAQLDHAFATARLLARQTRRMIAELEAESPDDGLNSVEVEFGVKFNGELQAYIAKANAEASMTIKLTWQIAEE